MLSADRLYLGLGRYDFFFVRRAVEAARVFLAVLPRLAAFVTARRACGFAAVTRFANSFCTDPALAAIMPSVAPIDSATLVRILSSLDDLWLSTANPLPFTYTRIGTEGIGKAGYCGEAAGAPSGDKSS